MKGIRRKEKEIKDISTMIKILQGAKYITLAMCDDKEPYLVTLSHGYDSVRNVIYFHCADEGRKIDVIKKNNTVLGQAIQDKGYVTGKCNQLYETTQFHGKVTFITDVQEKKHGDNTSRGCSPKGRKGKSCFAAFRVRASAIQRWK